MIKNKEPDFLGRGWSYLVATARGFITTSQDSENIKQSILIILQTAKGERIMLPNFGSDLNKLVFAPINETTLSLASFYAGNCLNEWEPRIIVDNIDTTVATQEKNCLLISIDYSIKEKNSPDNLVYPFYLQVKR